MGRPTAAATGKLKFALVKVLERLVDGSGPHPRLVITGTFEPDEPPSLTAAIEPPRPSTAAAQAEVLKIVREFGEEWSVGVENLDLAWLDSAQGPHWDLDPHYKDLD